MSKSDSGVMAATVAIGALTIAGALYLLSKAKTGTGTSGLGALINWQPANTVRGTRGWGTPGWGRARMGRTGSAVYWQRVA